MLIVMLLLVLLLLMMMMTIITVVILVVYVVVLIIISVIIIIISSSIFYVGAQSQIPWTCLIRSAVQTIWLAAKLRKTLRIKLIQSRCTDTRSTSPSNDPITPGIHQGRRLRLGLDKDSEIVIRPFICDLSFV